ncbi:hypothetical protein ACTMTI_42210 [Nonomuraea sp. H19]|uniref:hypothetical protein n=1 Tax=Nonomuraea sp. H19 TaxID=3452206 RepID=UPI003F8CBA13
MHLNTESRRARTLSLGRVATFVLAAAAGAVLLPAGQGVAGASSTTTTGVSYASHETPPLHCTSIYTCGHSWWAHRRWHHPHGWSHRYPDWRYRHHDGTVGAPWRHHGDHS